MRILQRPDLQYGSPLTNTVRRSDGRQSRQTIHIRDIQPLIDTQALPVAELDIGHGDVRQRVVIVQIPSRNQAGCRWLR